ncbi:MULTISPECIES: type 1 glutamine amidotransferase domain-containing protein [Rhodococcus]|uniref:Type 1 glutamine amidotransferase domain-containing protein n=1 Tax=Rhodococcus rhodochrous TaxID=1829 RepID=A0AA46WYB9_RHORH|nr:MULTISPECIES: type 1 glutamine amidotransferase domain-containing protein [Rhodococcus]AYA25554.1 type 1 glutamine amidotransferase domain-containing protein [Rhodococcus rhodochrous]MCB8912743.1 type 1 glutamine amidotransferase domain-containing protein [Rhodococcus rhodochrous]MCD2096428.1 type 1 glutamine amidotransferase domain-containing protein [Rhodococcus rhodochrous]MCD2121354.1 type 1 glutamine amidotransferase domain-containing protein [Rhodococcus rhodochrous]MCQ4135435.1 type 
MTRILFVVSSADHWTLQDGTRHPTGFWAEELVEPYTVFDEAGYDITVATPGGRTPVVDQASLEPDAAGGEDRVAELKSALEKLQPVLSGTAVLEDQRAEDFDLLFVPGGHGPMEDLAVDERFGELVRHFVEADKVVAMVCHAPAALLPAHDSGGRWLFEGYNMTAFTNVEEVQAGLADKAPWLLQDRLQEAGAVFSSTDAWQPYVVVDRVLYTGQNPASSRPLAERVVAEVPARATS